jgi:undecaprenyl-diphosphatase
MSFLHWLTQLDQKLFLLLNSEWTNPLFDISMPIITNQYLWGFPLLLAWVGLQIWGGRKGRIAAWVFLIAVISADIISAQFIKPLVGRLRPSHAHLETLRLLVPPGGKYGFVSSHATNTMSGAVVLSYFYTRYKKIFITLPILVGFSRVYVGVHYPGDVLGGWLLGYILGWITLLLWVLLRQRELKQGRQWVQYEVETLPSPREGDES